MLPVDLLKPTFTSEPLMPAILYTLAHLNPLRFVLAAMDWNAPTRVMGGPVAEGDARDEITRRLVRFLTICAEQVSTLWC